MTKKTKSGNDLAPPAPVGAKGELRLLKAGFGFFQPDIWIVDAAGEPRVWKSWHRRPTWERILVDGRLAQREGRVLRALSDLEGFPRFLSYPNKWTVEMTLLDAEEVANLPEEKPLSPIYFNRLWEMLSAMHARGVNHGDLRRKNLLRATGDPNTPRMVDFTQSFHFPTPGPVRRMLLRQAVRVDRVTFLKLKGCFLGKNALTQEEQRDLADVPWHLKLGRFVRKKLYRPVRRALQKRRGIIKKPRPPDSNRQRESHPQDSATRKHIP